MFKICFSPLQQADTFEGCSGEVSFDPDGNRVNYTVDVFVGKDQYLSTSKVGFMDPIPLRITNIGSFFLMNDISWIFFPLLMHVFVALERQRKMQYDIVIVRLDVVIFQVFMTMKVSRMDLELGIF